MPFWTEIENNVDFALRPVPTGIYLARPRRRDLEILLAYRTAQGATQVGVAERKRIIIIIDLCDAIRVGSSLALGVCETLLQEGGDSLTQVRDLTETARKITRREAGKVWSARVETQLDLQAGTDNHNDLVIASKIHYYIANDT